MTALRRAKMAIALVLAAALAAAVAVDAHADGIGRYQQRNLVTDVTDGSISADNVDSNLVNAWGVAFNPFGPVWVAANGTGVSVLYDGAGVAQPTTTPKPLVVSIPAAAGQDGSNPTGIVFNGSTGFVVKSGGNSGPAAFLFVTEDGVLAGWSRTVDPTHAILVKDNSASGTVYKGLALSAGGNGSLLYATDFHNNKIDVWDSTFTSVTLPVGAFTDPKLPDGYAPFGIQAINGNLYVTYAKQDDAAHDDVKGRGFGFVDVFDPNGVLLGRFASRGRLNAPWGIALAPDGFGDFRDSLLIGNFGDGRINAFDLATGQALGELRGPDGKAITIDGLWGLAFGNGFAGQPVNTLFFAAGPAGESHGLYGRIDPLPNAHHGD